MSDVESSNPSDPGAGEEMTMYECRKCPGQRFTAAERDIHRLSHRNDKRPKAKPKSKQKGRASSPSRSELTLFDPVVIRQTSDGEEEVVTPSPASPGKGGKGKRKVAAGGSGPPDKPDKNKKERRQRKSIKRYQPENMPSTRYNSG